MTADTPGLDRPGPDSILTRAAPLKGPDRWAGSTAWSDHALDEALSTALYETIGALVVVLDRKGRIVRFNPACERLTGYTAREAAGCSVAEFLVPPDEADDVRAAFGRLAAGDFPNAHENAWLTRAGDRRRIAWSNTALTDPDGRVAYIVGVGIDVTERFRAEETISGIEAVRSVLAVDGLTPKALSEIVAVLTRRFGYTHVSIYLTEGTRLRLGAAVGYATPDLVLDVARGVIGRVVRTQRSALIRDVTQDPDYVSFDPAVRSEVSVPLLISGELLGVLNVESVREDRPLDEQDLVLLEAVADRLASSTALGRERHALAARADLLAGLQDFAQAVTSTLQEEVLWDLLVGGVAKVLPADLVVLTVLDRPSGRYLVRGARGLGPSAVGTEILPGEGVTGRALRDRLPVVVEDLPRSAYPPAVRALVASDGLAAVAVPLIRKGAIVGALMVGRADVAQQFSALELDALGILTNQAALAVANTFLYAEVAESAIHDALTGLHNRRFLDTTLERIVAAWVRTPAQARRPLSAVMFDLDHFGRFNRDHGHLVGDALLQVFGDILRRRFRASDLVARFGGEEFVAVLEGTTLDGAVLVAEEVRQAFRDASVPGAHGEALSCTVSAGCAALENDYATPQALLQAADVGLFSAKRAGRDRVEAVREESEAPHGHYSSRIAAGDGDADGWAVI
jgi:diguanylate cyclase (GGDEF)-like protein/PAS domain S-box-containing protein